MSVSPTRLGIGTYLGELSDSYSQQLTKTLVFANQSLGITTIDTAISYRCQRSEKVIGDLLRSGKLKREDIFLMTKGGFIPFEDQIPANVPTAILEKYQIPLKLSPHDIRDHTHCLHPDFIAWSFEKSLSNMCTEYVDVFFIHNPEYAKPSLSQEAWEDKILKCFEYLEQQVAKGRCGCYGLSTWEGLRVPEENSQHISLGSLFKVVEGALGKNNHFKAIQLPINAYSREFMTLKNQRSETHKPITVQVWALAYCFLVFGSTPLLQGQLLNNARKVLKPEEWNNTLSPAQNIMFWALKQPGVTSTLLGTASMEHLQEIEKILPKSY